MERSKKDYGVKKMMAKMIFAWEEWVQFGDEKKLELCLNVILSYISKCNVPIVDPENCMQGSMKMRSEEEGRM